MDGNEDGGSPRRCHAGRACLQHATASPGSGWLGWCSSVESEKAEVPWRAGWVHPRDQSLKGSLKSSAFSFHLSWSQSPKVALDFSDREKDEEERTKSGSQVLRSSANRTGRSQDAEEWDLKGWYR